MTPSALSTPGMGIEASLPGLMDVKADIAAVAITCPRGDVLFFDVSDPAKPKFLSRYNATECDPLLEDVDCGAFVDLSRPTARPPTCRSRSSRCCRRCR